VQETKVPAGYVGDPSVHTLVVLRDGGMKLDGKQGEDAVLVNKEIPG
jgi:hypothetical protein